MGHPLPSSTIETRQSMRITFTQSGGFSGTIKGCQIDPSDLAQDDRQELESLVAGSGVTASFEQFSESGRDLRQYEIMIERDAAVQRIACDDRSVPEAIRPLVAFLVARARPQSPDVAEAARRRAVDG
jgi:hypothetical protein